MATVLDLAPSPVDVPRAGLARELALPASLDQVVWRGGELGHQRSVVASSGWPELDNELPGGGWPQQCVVEVLTAQPAVLEWRLLAPGLRSIVDAGKQVVVVGPPRQPHLPGLAKVGLNEKQFIWLQADAPAERLWATEQLIKSNGAGAIVAWLPKTRPEQIRRLQVCAQACESLVFLCRPEAARHESSAAPLRLQVGVGLDWELKVHLLKRRGTPHVGELVLPSVPGGLTAVLTPRLRRPSRLINREASNDAVGSTPATSRPDHLVTA